MNKKPKMCTECVCALVIQWEHGYQILTGKYKQIDFRSRNIKNPWSGTNRSGCCYSVTSLCCSFMHNYNMIVAKVCWWLLKRHRLAFIMHITINCLDNNNNNNISWKNWTKLLVVTLNPITSYQMHGLNSRIVNS